MKLFNTNAALCITALICSGSLFGMRPLPAMQSTTPERRTSPSIMHTALPQCSPLTTPERATLYAYFRASRYNTDALSPWLNTPVTNRITILSPSTPVYTNEAYRRARAAHYQQVIQPATSMIQLPPRPNRYLAVPQTAAYPVFALSANAAQGPSISFYLNNIPYVTFSPSISFDTSNVNNVTAKQPVKFEVYVPQQGAETTTERERSISFDTSNASRTARQLLFEHEVTSRTQRMIADISKEENAFWDQSLNAMEKQVGITKTAE